MQLTLLCESAIGLDTKNQSAARDRIFETVGETLAAHAHFALLLANKERVQGILEWWVHYEIAVLLIQEFGVQTIDQLPEATSQNFPMSIYGCSADYAEFF